jgi:DNA-directed RNA polymerase subunit A'
MKPVRKQIKALSFSLLSPEQIKKLSVAKIVTPELYDVDGFPVDGGLMDLRMGVIDPGLRCRTDGATMKECPGYPGSIEFARPVLHLKYIPLIELFLRCYCHECGKMLLTDDMIQKYPPSARIKKAKDAKKCPHCSATHEKVKIDKPTTFYTGKKRLYPTEIREILSRITDDEVKKAGVNPKTSRPEWAVINVLLVPPVTVRPSITLESGERSEDDLTHKLSDIIRANQRLWENLNAGAPEVIIEDLWDLLQFHVTTFFDNTVTRIPPARHRSGQPLKTITERIKGKEGRIRKNLSGKRVNFSARTVISPDPYLRINEVGVPYEVAKVITVAERVNSTNIEELKKLIQSAEYPKANYIIRPDGKRKKVTEDLREEIINEIQPGYKVERQLRDGDIVLFNRHPSLHKGSLMMHYVKVLPYKTFRLHPAVVFPYNADFDGDEMNIHSPQTEEARAEAKILLDVNSNLISPKNGANLIGCIADAITGNYLLSLRAFGASEAAQLLYQSGIDPGMINKKNIEGREVFSMALPKELNYNSHEHFSNPIKVKNGLMVEGVINGTTFGVEEGELVKAIDNQLGRDVTVDSIRKVFSLGVNYLSQRGITISLGDLDVSKRVGKYTDETVKEAEKKVQSIIESYYNGSIEVIPGKSEAETREIKILQTLNEVRTKLGIIVKKEFPDKNPVSYMIASGAGGNIVNITQMSCSVGQQALWGRRIDLGYTRRTLSFFEENDLSPKSRGFIYSSFIKGLQPYEFFFGAITGRDSLMDTALRTPKSGYLYRRLANALQDIRVEYDRTVRDGSGTIIQYEFGDDGLDPANLHSKKKVTPGEAVGIIAAQSLGEPSTQMALNVFHFAGVQEMQVTSGLPRLIEIFDARKKPSSPKMEIYLDKDFNDEDHAREIAERIKEVTLKEVASEISINFSDKKIEVELNPHMLKRIKSNTDKVVEVLKKKALNVKSREKSITISSPDLNFKELYKMKEKLKSTIVSGIKGISQILIVKRDKNFVILTAGTNFKEILQIKGVDTKRTITNDLYEIMDVLGVESARQAIINEIQGVINPQGLDIDNRYLKLVAEAMCNSGTIKGITRMGIISQKSSILARASFETPIKQFVSATMKGSKDYLNSVIENIIVNQPVPIGTGLPGLLVKVTGPLAKEKSALEELKSSGKK